MKMVQKESRVNTRGRTEMVDITGQVEAIVRQSGIANGSVVVFCPHTTAAITINENADPDVVHDVLLALDEIVPRSNHRFQHSEGNSDAHCKSSLVGCSEQVLLQDGRLVLGTWQAIYFCEFDGPRSRRVIVQVQGE
ncbi:MAG: YjbQ family protein [Sedimentisphaerales bacterium]|nr:YjbQ family protein [Sedimentisphaerales bacterium]